MVIYLAEMPYFSPKGKAAGIAGKTLFFSKKLENHIGAIWYFIHHYNACIRAKLQGSTT
jgi:hypothetical protein